MTREELDEHIEYVSHTACGYPPISIMASEVERWLEDIRDNGITEPKKYTIKVLGNDEAFLIKTPKGGFYFGTLISADAYGDQKEFTQAEIDKFKKCGDIAIDWNKAIIEPVEDNEDED